MGEFQTRKYFTEEDRLAAKRVSSRASRARHRLADIMRKRKARAASIRGPYRTAVLEEEERPPPQVLAALALMLAKTRRRPRSPSYTPTEYWIGIGPKGVTRTDYEGRLG